MRPRVLAFLAIAVLLIGGGVVGLWMLFGPRSGADRMVPYVPVEMYVTGGPLYAEEPSVATPAHLDALAEVLQEYEIEYVRRGDEILIPRSLKNDRDLLMNFTHKADDRRAEKAAATLR